MKVKNTPKNIINIIIASMVVFIIIFIVLKGGERNKKIEFETMSVTQGRLISTVVTTGKVQAVTTVQVGAQVSGKIQALYADFNSKVRRGDKLAVIDPSILQARVNEAQASYDSAAASLQNMESQQQNAKIRILSSQAAVQNAKSQIHIAETSVLTAKNDEAASEANYQKALAHMENYKKDAQRLKNLLARDFVSKTDYDAADTKYRAASADLQVAANNMAQASLKTKAALLQLESAKTSAVSAELALRSQEESLVSAGTDVAKGKALLRQNLEQLQQAKVNLGYTVIYSPIDGIVTKRNVDIGQTVASSFSAPVLFEIAQDLKNMEVIANVDEADIGKVKENQKVSFTVDAYPDTKFQGNVKQVRAAATESNSVVTYQVVISADNKELKLLPSMTANITILTELRNNCLKIPNIALRFKPENIKNFPFPQERTPNRSSLLKTLPQPSAADKRDSLENEMFTGDKIKKRKKEKLSSVWLLLPDGKVKEEKIVTGLAGSSFTEMKKGNLKAGDLLITGSLSAKAKSNSSSVMKGGGYPYRRREARL